MDLVVQTPYYFWIEGLISLPKFCYFVVGTRMCYEEVVDSRVTLNPRLLVEHRTLHRE